MSERAVRIAMWSGPRNISTAMMRAFENRPDTAVVDEPFYAFYLARTGAAHPMRDEVLASQPTAADAVVSALLGPVPEGKEVFYQKHMTHHMLPELDLDWVRGLRSSFLIRHPEDVLSSYAEVRGDATAEDVGIPQQRRLFDLVCQQQGLRPPVIDSHDVLTDPRGILGKLCQALGIAFSDSMLQWPRGRRASDGVWAPAWYASVEASTGFASPRLARAKLPSHLQRVADEVMEDYAYMAAHKLT